MEEPPVEAIENFENAPEEVNMDELPNETDDNGEEAVKDISESQLQNQEVKPEESTKGEK